MVQEFQLHGLSGAAPRRPADFFGCPSGPGLVGIWIVDTEFRVVLIRQFDLYIVQRNGIDQPVIHSPVEIELEGILRMGQTVVLRVDLDVLVDLISTRQPERIFFEKLVVRIDLVVILLVSVFVALVLT